MSTKKHGAGFWVLIAVVGVVALCLVGGVLLAAVGARSPDVHLNQGQGQSTATEKPLSNLVTIEDGTWTVGVDIKAGKYKTSEVVTSDCYWQITKAGTTDILSNDIPGGGLPSVTLKKGQDFKSMSCGTWVKE